MSDGDRATLEQTLLRELGSHIDWIERERLRLFTWRISGESNDAIDAEFFFGRLPEPGSILARQRERYQAQTPSLALMDRQRSVTLTDARARLKALAKQAEALAESCERSDAEGLAVILDRALGPGGLDRLTAHARYAADEVRGQLAALPGSKSGRPPSTSDVADVARHVAMVWSLCGLGEPKASDSDTRFLRALSICCAHFGLAEPGRDTVRKALGSPRRGGIPIRTR